MNVMLDVPGYPRDSAQCENDGVGLVGELHVLRGGIHCAVRHLQPNHSRLVAPSSG